ncbi:MAG TPA: hypothetical protein VGM09_26890 [Bradyrhizobium sp.]|jgi:hypothetical protein
MSRHTLVLILLFGSLVTPVSVSAQLVPPAGTAGAGLTPIHGVPFGPNNPSALSDPSGLLNASKVPPLHPNPPLAPPPPQPVFRSFASPERAAPPYASRRVFSANEIDSRKPIRRHGRPHVSSFTGICRGC